MPTITCENCGRMIPVGLEDLTQVIECARCRARFTPLPHLRVGPPQKPRRSLSEVERNRYRQPDPPSRPVERPRRVKRRARPRSGSRWEVILGVSLGLLATIVLTVGAVLLVRYSHRADDTTKPAVEQSERTTNPVAEVSKALPVPAEDAEFAGWQDFSSALGRFSIRMPKKPQYKVNDVDRGVGPQHSHVFHVDTEDGTEFEISYCDFPDIQETSPNALALFDTGFQNLAKANNAFDIDGPRPIRIESHAGKEASCKFGVTGKAGSARMRYCMVGDRGYVLLVRGVGDFAHSKAADYFLNSFRVNP